MNRQERMISLHTQSLSSVMGGKYKKVKFETHLSTIPGENDTVISSNRDQKVAVITRHLLDATCAPTHSLILEGETFNRI